MLAFHDPMRERLIIWGFRLGFVMVGLLALYVFTHS
jgi:hypothetical protein